MIIIHALLLHMNLSLVQRDAAVDLHSFNALRLVCHVFKLSNDLKMQGIYKLT